MITADFFKSHGNKLLGFAVSGHSGYEDAGKDIVCAAVSSAVMLTANQITETFGLDARVKSDGDTVCLKFDGENETGDKILLSLLLHLQIIEEEYPEYVKISLHER